jgi:hypothetical protein
VAAKKSPEPSREQEHREEAERLAQFPAAEQGAILAWHRDIAADAKLSKADRRAARERADALESYIRRARKKRKHDNK